MVDVTLTIYSLGDAREVPLTGDRISIGRGDGSDLSINDDGLSRVHATIYREGERVWILDEASTNGTCVNNVPVASSGAALADGDEVTIGNDTTILIHIRKAGNLASPGLVPKRLEANSWNLPLIFGAAGIVIVLLISVAIGRYAVGRKTSDDSAERSYQYRGSENVNRSPDDQQPSKSNSGQAASPLPEPDLAPTVAQDPAANLPLNPVTPSGSYSSMTKEQQTNFVSQEAQRVAWMIGNREGFAFTPQVVTQIKIYVDAYARRLHSRPVGGSGCTMRDDLRTLLARASQHAPLVIKSFNANGLAPQVGLYLAMIEAEYCPCLSSGTGPKGMFQFACSTAKRYGVQDVSSPKDVRWDDRCKVEIMAPIAARYVKDLEATYGTGPLSVPLAIASYNSGEGGLSSNLIKALNSVRGSERSFWTMVAESSQLSSQFQRENFKYVPKFFGAAIVGENPRVFGVDMEPLSAHTASANSNGND